MNIKKFTKLNWKKKSASDHFQAVAEISDGLMREMTASSEKSSVVRLNFDREVSFMTQLMDGLSYSPYFITTMNRCAEQAADSVAQAPLIQRYMRNWFDLEKQDLQLCAATSQRCIASTIKGHGLWGTYNRKTNIVIINKKPRLDFYGNRRILQGSMSCVTEGSVQKEILKMNMHPSSAISDPSDWFGVQFHENGHGMEAIYKRYNNENLTKAQVGKDNDSQLLMAKSVVFMGADFRDIAYDTYVASPSERIVRGAQAIFVDRLRSKLPALKAVA